MLGINFLRQSTLFTSTGIRALYTCPVLERARRGTRMRKEAIKKARKKEKIVEQKKEFIPYKKRLEMEKVGKSTPRIDDNEKDYPIDDVYIGSEYKWSRYIVAEALALLAETQHPSQYNNLHASVMAHIELSMAADKKNQFIREFSNVFLFPHYFEVPHFRTTLAICTDENMVNEMKQFGVTFALEYKQTIKMAKKGELDFKKYNHVICHATLLPELIGCRAYLGKQFPSPREGTAGHDIVAIARRFLKGVEYKAQQDKYDHDFGKIETQIGTLDMGADKIEENLKALLTNIEECRPKTRSKGLITLVSMYCAGFDEHFIIDHQQYCLPVPEIEEERVTVEQ